MSNGARINHRSSTGKVYAMMETCEELLAQLPPSQDVERIALRIMTKDGKGVSMSLREALSRDFVKFLDTYLSDTHSNCKAMILSRSIKE